MDDILRPKKWFHFFIIFYPKICFGDVIDNQVEIQIQLYLPLFFLFIFFQIFMIAQNILISTQQAPFNEQDDPSQCSFEILFRNIHSQNAKIPFLRSVQILENEIRSKSKKIGAEKLISKKMRTKLLTWLEKLALETFEFSGKTLILSMKILDQYLNFTNESPQSFQLIGCACLYLAAKTYESTIVACKCYVIASANTFTEKQLYEKQLEIYKIIGYSTKFVCPLRVYNFLVLASNYTILNKYSSKNIQKLFIEIAKNTEFYVFDTLKILSTILALAQILKKIPTPDQLLQKLQQINLLPNQPRS